MSFACVERCIEVKDEVMEFGGYWDGGEDEAACVIDSSRWLICGIEFVGDIARVNEAVVVCEDGMYAFEDVIGWSIAASALPPAFDNAAVVSKNLKFIAFVADGE